MATRTSAWVDGRFTVGTERVGAPVVVDVVPPVAVVPPVVDPVVDPVVPVPTPPAQPTTTAPATKGIHHFFKAKSCIHSLTVADPGTLRPYDPNALVARAYTK